MEEVLSFINRKEANSNQELLQKLAEKGTVHQYGLVLPLNKIAEIPGAVVALMHIMNQNTINAHVKVT